MTWTGVCRLRNYVRGSDCVHRRTTITTVGVGNPSELAGGISQALITTASGLSVAIPSLIFHRYFRGKIDALVVSMEQETIKLVEVLQHKREGDYVVKRTRAKR